MTTFGQIVTRSIKSQNLIRLQYKEGHLRIGKTVTKCNKSQLDTEFVFTIPIQVTEACFRPAPPRPPPPPHRFHCDSQYGSWDPSRWTYQVPNGDFCSSRNSLPGRPVCARNERREAPKIVINDGEGTDCMIEMFNSPGK